MLRVLIRHEQLGGHVHMDVFAGLGTSLGLSGTLLLRVEEFVEFRSVLERNAPKVFVFKQKELQA